MRSLAPIDHPIMCCVPLAEPTLSDEQVEATAAVFAALSDPARVRIVNRIAATGEPVCACHLTEPLGLSQPTVSHHLKKLVEAGLLQREQRGKWAYFSLKPGANSRLARVVELTRTPEEVLS
jgi:ArsR family transcriptional regulator, arsenate/arsenite/antimonite-responsive transcriptional repressor